MSAAMGTLVIAISTEFSVLSGRALPPGATGGPRAGRGAVADLPLHRRGRGRIGRHRDRRLRGADRVEHHDAPRLRPGHADRSVGLARRGAADAPGGTRRCPSVARWRGASASWPAVAARACRGCAAAPGWRERGGGAWRTRRPRRVCRRGAASIPSAPRRLGGPRAIRRRRWSTPAVPADDLRVRAAAGGGGLGRVSAQRGRGDAPGFRRAGRCRCSRRRSLPRTLNGAANLHPHCTPAQHDPRALNVCLLVKRGAARAGVLRHLLRAAASSR